MSDDVINSSRRRLLGGAIAVAAVAASPSALASVRTFSDPAYNIPTIQNTDDFWARPRVLNIKRYQNNEQLNIAYWKDGRMDVEAYQRVCWLMRDIRAGQAIAIDPRVLDLMCAMQAWVGYYGYRKPFLISSGYRTAGTNNNLEGAAKNSMHLYGRAVDLIFPDLPVGYIGQLAQHYSAGGVGFYPSRGFVHVDTGRVRSWGRR